MYLSREQVRQIDRRAVQDFGIPVLMLMENAGRGVAEVLDSLGPPGRVVICCGKGNNGGDGMVAARHLVNLGWKVEIVLALQANKSLAETLSSEAIVQWSIAQQMGIPATILEGVLDEADLVKELRQTDWIVDALFGTGLAGPLRPPFDRLVELINASGKNVLAVDIPSGLDADTGEPLGATVRASHTVTFVAPKKGFQNPAAAKYIGKIHVADIGAPRSLIEEIGAKPS